MVSTPAGCASVFSSDAHAAAVTCAIISPERSPPSRVRNAGRPLLRRIDEPIGPPLADRRERHERDREQVGGDRDRRAVEVAAGDDLAGVGEHHRVVGRALASISTVRRTNASASRAAPCTWAAQRIE